MAAANESALFAGRHSGALGTLTVDSRKEAGWSEV
jgi:hypothetical protein